MRQKRYSVSLVYFKNMSNGDTDISLRVSLRYANSKEEALGAAIEDLSDGIKDYALNNKVVLEIK